MKRYVILGGARERCGELLTITEQLFLAEWWYNRASPLMQDANNSSSCAHFGLFEESLQSFLLIIRCT